ncbi:MAG: class I SAM-dependent methyltransferase [Hyphomicrobiaceae bacterium]
MSFSPEWLALREPADHASVNAHVRDLLRARFAGRETVRVVDLGCGAGSNLRGTWNTLGPHQSWTLVDYDPKLLAAARTRLAKFGKGEAAGDAGLSLTLPGTTIDVGFRQADLSQGALGPVVDGADLVTAAALFDLASAKLIDELVDAVAARRQTFFTVLTYDGIASWLPEHPADTAMREAFNAHQRGNKGFGPALGPAATDAMAKAFARHGYHVTRGKSPWVLDHWHLTLRRELDQGFAGAVRETGRVPSADIDNWLAKRRANDDAVTIIGHEDLLAVPA